MAVITGGYNPYYRDLKDSMKRLCIKYSDLSIASGYSVNTINLWLHSPEEEYRKQIVKQAIMRIENHRKCGEADKYTPKTNRQYLYSFHNRELRSELKRYGITQTQIAKTLGIKRQTVTRWIGEPLSPYREKAIKSAVARLLQKP